ncbi:hypothetical protein PanWU01x14_062200, partial [Parasponia andersonii]
SILHVAIIANIWNHRSIKIKCKKSTRNYETTVRKVPRKTLNISPKYILKYIYIVGAVFTSCSRVSELLMLYLPTVHVSLLSQNAFDFRQGQRSGRTHLQRLSDT